MVSGTRCPCVCVCECDGERGSGPEGADDLCSVSLGALGWNLSLAARISALKLGFEPQSSRLGFESQGWDLSLKAGI